MLVKQVRYCRYLESDDALVKKGKLVIDEGGKTKGGEKKMDCILAESILRCGWGQAAGGGAAERHSMKAGGKMEIA